MQRNETFKLSTLSMCKHLKLFLKPSMHYCTTHRVVAHHGVLQRVVDAAPVAEEVPGDLHDGEDGPLAADLVHDVLH